MGALIALAVVVVLLLVGLGTAVNLVQQGFNGVVTRFGRYHRESGSGICLIWPFFDKLVRVDMRETPRTGDRQDVITRDNVAVAVNATIFSQVIDAKAALFNVSNYFIAIDQQARTTLRNAFGNVSLDDALSQREQINAAMQQQMEQVTDKWGIRINRIEIVDILPPSAVLAAMSLQKEAEQQKRALILKAEGERQAAINQAEGQKQAAILAAEGQKQAQVRQAEGEKEAVTLRAQGRKAALIQEAEGRAQAVQLVYDAILTSKPTPELLAVLQLDTLSRLVESNNAKLVVPYESAGLMGASQMLKTVLEAAGGGGGGAGRNAGGSAGSSSGGGGPALGAGGTSGQK
ncbi:MAG TPA: hypothetical protein DCX12_09370 [Chloroflexi bacterium]|nr:hypothetical protein [Chloroflexota bacterium]